MPYHNFVCPEQHVTEKLFLSFQAAEGVYTTPCPVCGKLADRTLGVPYPAHLHGNPDGYYKPSPQKRFSYKLMTERGNGDRV